MSVDNLVFVAADSLISVKEWQEIIDLNGFLAVLDQIDPKTHEGFLPCTYGGEECGFEYSIEPLDEEFRGSLDLDIPDEWNSVVTFTTRSSLLDLAMSTVAASTLANATGGAFLGEGECCILRGSEALDWARKTLCVYDQELEAGKDQAEKANAIMDQLGDDQDAIDAMFAQVLESLAGSVVRAVNANLSLSIHLSNDNRVSFNSWKVVSKDGCVESRIELDDFDSYEEYSAARDAAGDQSVRVTQMLSDPSKDAVIANVSMSSGNDIELEFANGAVAIGEASPYYVDPWQLDVDIISWFYDKDGVNCRPY